jgi:hypothetical protein
VTPTLEPSPSPMAKKRDDEPVRVDKEVLRVCRIVAAYRGVSISEYISTTLGPIARADLLAEQAKEVTVPSSADQPRRRKSKD